MMDNIIRDFKLYEDYLNHISDYKGSNQYLTFSLKQAGKTRILYQMFTQIKKKKAKMSPDYIVLVVDSHTAHLVASYCQLFELINYASIYQIEKIDKTRKRYPQSDVIYFLDPHNAESIDRLVADFPPDDQDEIPYD